ncbi:type I-B CRISPR-associated protein Cas7/Cst2/DevR [Aminobacterium sp. UBA5514]|jgi:CRISPR-associated protein Cst2|uniref:type I-B CRISPR-associated protein Cas7/Cst2/DevR n=2 Tax=Aminobacterium TaxID=81466 RepID=UPI00258034D0|nr:type I-B CRISPR-associated protein Cas7/Cst2/DevR [Aminobacterium sp. UBA5514]
MIKNAKALTVTYLVKTTLGSLNGSDKEADNLSSIKKFTYENEDFPYGSSQWVRRALRDQLSNLGWELSEGKASTINKGAATTMQDPVKYIDDDLFGFMGTVKGQAATKRTSPLRVSPLVSLTPYTGDLDFGTNYMSVNAGGNPNIFETEICAGFYRGTILIELDRVGTGDGFNEDLTPTQKAERVNAILDSLQNLWSSGRQSRFLTDISPKFIASAILSTKNPIFLETLMLEEKTIQLSPLIATLEDFKKIILDNTFGVREGFFDKTPEDTLPMGKAFDKMREWVRSIYTEE